MAGVVDEEAQAGVQSGKPGPSIFGKPSSKRYGRFHDESEASPGSALHAAAEHSANANGNTQHNDAPPGISEKEKGAADKKVECEEARTEAAEAAISTSTYLAYAAYGAGAGWVVVNASYMQLPIYESRFGLETSNRMTIGYNLGTLVIPAFAIIRAALRAVGRSINFRFMIVFMAGVNLTMLLVAAHGFEEIETLVFLNFVGGSIGYMVGFVHQAYMLSKCNSACLAAFWSGDAAAGVAAALLASVQRPELGPDGIRFSGKAFHLILTPLIPLSLFAFWRIERDGLGALPTELQRAASDGALQLPEAAPDEVEEEEEEEFFEDEECMPQKGDVVKSKEGTRRVYHETGGNSPSRLDPWILREGELAVVVDVDEDGDFKLMNPAGEISGWAYRKSYAHVDEVLEKNALTAHQAAVSNPTIKETPQEAKPEVEHSGAEEKPEAGEERCHREFEEDNAAASSSQKSVERTDVQQAVSSEKAIVDDPHQCSGVRKRSKASTVPESKFGFTVGDQVSWTFCDSEIASGEIGIVVGFADGKVKVKFAKGVWTFEPAEFRKESDPDSICRSPSSMRRRRKRFKPLAAFKNFLRRIKRSARKQTIGIRSRPRVSALLLAAVFWTQFANWGIGDSIYPYACTEAAGENAVSDAEEEGTDPGGACVFRCTFGTVFAELLGTHLASVVAKPHMNNLRVPMIGYSLVFFLLCAAAEFGGVWAMPFGPGPGWNVVLLMLVMRCLGPFMRTLINRLIQPAYEAAHWEDVNYAFVSVGTFSNLFGVGVGTAFIEVD